MPSTMASAEATLLIATRRLATYFIRLPLPKAPTSYSLREKPANTGLTLATDLGSPLA